VCSTLYGAAQTDWRELPLAVGVELKTEPSSQLVSASRSDAWWLTWCLGTFITDEVD